MSTELDPLEALWLSVGGEQARQGYAARRDRHRQTVREFREAGLLGPDGGYRPTPAARPAWWRRLLLHLAGYDWRNPQ